MTPPVPPDGPLPSISVLVTAYGPCPFLAEALRSVRAQSVASGAYEIVLLTDRPRSLEPTMERPAEGPALRSVVHPEPRKGRFFAEGIRACRGRMVAILNDDDVWESERLSVLSKAMEEEPELGYHHTGARFFGEGIAHAPGRHRLTERGSSDPVVLRREQGRWPTRPGRFELAFNDSSIAVARRLLVPALPYLERIDASEDTFLFFAAATQAETMVADPRTLVHYRIHRTNSSASGLGISPAAVEAVQREFERRVTTYEVISEMVRALGTDRTEVARWAERGLRLSRLVSVLADGRAPRARRAASAWELLARWEAYEPRIDLAMVALGMVSTLSPDRGLQLMFRFGIQTGESDTSR